MELPNEITSIITQYAWAWRAPTRPNWREWKQYQEWKEQNELKYISDVKPRTSINDVLLGVSVAVCADIFIQVMIPYLRRKLK